MCIYLFVFVVLVVFVFVVVDIVVVVVVAPWNCSSVLVISHVQVWSIWCCRVRA
jgi:hypothetical protein